MRVIEPKPNRRRKALNEEAEDTESESRNFMKSRKLMVVLLLIIIVAIVGFLVFRWHSAQQAHENNKSSTKSSTGALSDTSAPAPKTKIKIFTAQQFKDLYDKITYPNTRVITDPPEISGNLVADARMRNIAEQRGYKLRSIPVAPIFKIGDPNLKDDDLLQQKSLDAWHELQAAAKKDGLPLRIVSAYRSPEYQRNLFLDRLAAKGVTISQVAAGQADTAVIDVLHTTALPGYSRHHTGYTVDLQCDNGTLEAFVNSPCYTWISKTNYLNAKLYGWIPSYPDGAVQQGPEPEPWEYVWVGKDAVRQ